MVTTKHRQLLAEQLEQALDNIDGAKTAARVAVLAGLLCRLEPDHPMVLRAEAWADGPGTELLTEALRRFSSLERHLSELRTIDPGLEFEERVDAVFTFDEGGAALYWMGAGNIAAEATAMLTPSIRAFPEAWRDMSHLATKYLQSVHPTCGDPTLGLWRAIEATAFEPADAVVVPLAPAARLKLGLGFRANVTAPPTAAMRLAAASDALRVPEFETLYDEGDVTVVLERPTRGDSSKLVISAPPGEEPYLTTLDGDKIELDATPDGDWEWQAQPGQYSLTVGEQKWPLFLD